MSQANRSRATLGLLLLGACSGIQPMPADQPCREAGYAIAARTFACTEDAELSNARYERFEAEYVCVPIDLAEAPENPANFPEDDYFHCAYAIDGLSCDEVLRRGDDLDAWLRASNACPYVVQRRDGAAYWATDGSDTGQDTGGAP
jgi:hypothetical protein